MPRAQPADCQNGQQPKSLPAWCVLGSLSLALLLIFTLGAPTLANSVRYADEISGKLNTTGRTISFPVSLRDDTHALGEVTIQITASDEVSVEKAGLLGILADKVGPELITYVNGLPDDHGFITLNSVSGNELKLEFDSGLQELKLMIAAAQRSVTDLNFAYSRAGEASAATVKPESMSGYVNIDLGVDHNWNENSRGALYDDGVVPRIEIDSALRLFGTVFENRASYEDNRGLVTCPHNAICTYGQVAGLKRQSSRLVHDNPENEVRVSVGDTEPSAVAFQRATDVLGISVEKSPRKLNPGSSLSPTGSGSFRLERSATVDVRVNGSSVQKLPLRAGNYNVRDLPLTTGSNDIELVIEEDGGRVETVKLSAYSDMRLLGSGKEEWFATAGIPSYLVDNERAYASGDWMASGFYRYGLSEKLTVEVNMQADFDVQMAGAGIDLGTPFGLIGLHLAGSSGAVGNGAALDVSWMYSNFHGLTGTKQESLHLNAELRSTDFRTPGELLDSKSGIFFPEHEYWLRLAGHYALPITENISATVSARYQFENEGLDALGPYRVVGDRYGADITLSSPLSENVTGSFLVGYSNELFSRNGFAAEEIDPEFRVGLRLNVRTDDGTSYTGSYDTLGKQAGLSATRSEGSGVGSWNTNVEAFQNGIDEVGAMGATVSYIGNRGELRLSHYMDSDSLATASLSGSNERHRSSLRLGTSIAFAGDKVAVGAPVRGGAFAILAPHESLNGHDVSVGTDEVIRAKADGWGNGLVFDLPAYAAASTSIDVADLPIGYSLGSGTFDTYAPYKAGHIFQVGSSNAMSVYGTLLKSDGEPLALQTGTARPISGNAQPVSVFTNGEGRFGAEGLGPGRWIIEMTSDEGAIVYTIDVAASTQGLVKLGDIAPDEDET